MSKFFSSASKKVLNEVREALKPLRSRNELKSSKVYDNTHNILVVGEDNFHFSKLLKGVVGSSQSIHATSAHPSGSNVIKTSGISENKAHLDHAFQETDPMAIADNETLRGTKKDLLYDRVVCYEPKDSVAFESFLAYSRDFISEQGEVHMFFNSKGPQSDWELERMAQEHGYVLNRGLKVPWDGKKNDHHFTVLPFMRDPAFKKKKDFSYPGQNVDWDAVALQQQAEAAAAAAGEDDEDDAE